MGDRTQVSLSPVKAPGSSQPWKRDNATRQHQKASSKFSSSPEMLPRHFSLSGWLIYLGSNPAREKRLPRKPGRTNDPKPRSWFLGYG